MKKQLLAALKAFLENAGRYPVIDPLFGSVASASVPFRRPLQDRLDRQMQKARRSKIFDPSGWPDIV
ncbi:MAG: hypothetical protein KJO55_07180 [Gammaproteobacteria bacterium]|nr:hypothetical protein [Gammaproteobacteria bacterium]NND60811.1 hypothetical protein [Gammaproteobacteria bacterium]